METITLDKQQQRRAHLLSRLGAGEITMTQVTSLLRCSERTVRRQMRRLLSEGVSSLLHGNSGRAPVNKTSEELRTRLKDLVGEDGRYSSLNTSHMCEVLAEREGIHLRRSTLDRLLRTEEVRKSSRSRSRRVFRHRERSARAGEMLQIDGSEHAWLGQRHPNICLLGAVDDATGDIVSLLFRPTEDQPGYLLLLRQIVTTFGIPQSIYHDKHTILRSPKSQTIDEELAGKVPMSQVQRVMDELGIDAIPAHSPQAKGRIERLWKTLQDRLLKEMALDHVNTIDEANAYLPAFIERFNRTFGVEPAETESAFVEVDADLDTSYYFAAMEHRTIRADHTLAFEGQTLHIDRAARSRSLEGERIRVHTSPEGETFLYLAKQRLTFKLLPARPKVEPKPAQVVIARPVDKEAMRRRRGYLYASP